MRIEILKCSNCNIYTLKKQCSSCNSLTKTSKPAKWSPLDKYGELRRLYKKRYLEK